MENLQEELKRQKEQADLQKNMLVEGEEKLQNTEEKLTEEINKLNTPEPLLGWRLPKCCVLIRLKGARQVGQALMVSCAPRIPMLSRCFAQQWGGSQPRD